MVDCSPSMYKALGSILKQRGKEGGKKGRKREREGVHEGGKEILYKSQTSLMFVSYHLAFDFVLTRMISLLFHM